MLILQKTAALHDKTRSIWHSATFSRRLHLTLILAFVALSLLFLLKKSALLPAGTLRLLPDTPFFAIQVAFTLVLATEVVDLVFAISESMALAASKQMEIMGLLLLRESFSDIGLLSGPVNPELDWFILLQIGMTAAAGLLLFIFRSLFIRLCYVQEYADMLGYTNVKKSICLFLLLFLGATVAYDLVANVFAGKGSCFFYIFYTTLIFTDILIVLVGQYFTTSFQTIFRNSGFAVSTLLMRISLGAPHYLCALLCIFASLYLLALAWAVARFQAQPEQRHRG